MKRLCLLAALLFFCQIRAAEPPLRIVDATRTGFPALSGLAYGCHLLTPARSIRMSRATPARAAAMLIQGETDLVIAEMRDSGSFSAPVLLSHPPFAAQAVTVSVHPDSTVSDISLETLKKILSEPLPKWSLLLPGAAHDIHLFSLKPTAPGAAIMDSLIWGSKIVSRGRMFRADSSHSVLQLAAQDPSSLAIAFYTVQPPAMIKILKVNGVLPTEESLKKKLYPLTAGFCCITTRDGGKNDGTQTFLRYLAGDPARELLRKFELLPL